jgi:hypothetical protein
MKERYQLEKPVEKPGPYPEAMMRWQEIESRIVCRPGCKRATGIKRFERRIEHDTVIYVAQCRECSAKAMEWGYDNYVITGEPEMRFYESQE